jgi:hypothetical protein
MTKTPDHSACAVWGCASQGKPQACPFDGERHGHGRVHYKCNRAGLVFRQGWHLLCDDHYRQILAAAKHSHPYTA